MDDQSLSAPVLAEVVEPVLQTHWDAIQSNRDAIKDVLDRMAASFPGEGAKRLASLSQWFSQRRSFEDALIRADVLAVCLPLCRKIESNGEVSQADIAAGARVGFCSIGQNSRGGRQLLKALAYPAVVLFLAAVVAVGFSVFVMPQFEEMYSDFGIDLPWATDFFFSSAKFLRSWSFVIILWPLLFFGIILFLDRLTVRRRPDGLGWLDLCTQSSRSALADWAWHVSLLLEAGLTQATAMHQASRFAGKSWLRKGSHFWVGNQRADGAEVVQNQGETARFLGSPKFQLLDLALTIPNTEGKIQLLREVASYYRDRNRNIGLWWVQWLVAVLLWGIGALVLAVVFSLFSPLFSIMTGLTG